MRNFSTMRLAPPGCNRVLLGAVCSIPSCACAIIVAGAGAHPDIGLRRSSHAWSMVSGKRRETSTANATGSSGSAGLFSQASMAIRWPASPMNRPMTALRLPERPTMHAHPARAWLAAGTPQAPFVRRRERRVLPPVAGAARLVAHHR